ncbi:MAG: hypothetical protein ACJZ4O_00240 [Pelagibacteraceae bacterium]
MKLIFFLFFFLLIGCSISKTTYICGDRECLNKKEAEIYFKENLIIEVKVKNKDEKKIDLISLNKNSQNEIIEYKENISYKILSKKEKKEIQKRLKKREKLAKRNEKLKNKRKKRNNKLMTNRKMRINDICSKTNNCDIDEISDYLLKLGKNRNFPDINNLN